MNNNLKAITIYALLVVIFTWPLLPHITTHYPSTFSGEGGDPNMYIWFMDAIAKKVTTPSFHPSQMLFYPGGMNLMAGYEAPILLTVSTPIILAWHNPILAYNLILLLSFLLTCFACFKLIFYLTKSFIPSLITGASFGLSPYMMVRGVQHLDLLSLYTLPWVVLCAFRFVENPNRKNIFFLSVAILVTALSAWYYLVGCLIFLVLFWIFNFNHFLQHIKQYIWAGVGIAMAVLIPAIPMFVYRSTASINYVKVLVESRGANPLNFFVPHPYMFSSTWSIYNFFASPYESTSYFGLVGLIALVTLGLMRKEVIIPFRKLWIISIIMFTVIAIGNHIYVFHHQIPMPFYFLSKFLPFNHLRAPNRFFVFAYLATTIVFGYFLAYCKNYFQKPIRWQMFVSVLLIGLVAERWMGPYPILKMDVPEFYRTIGNDGGNYAIADVPFLNPGLSIYDYYQIYHGKPIVDGEYFWTAYTDHTFDFARSNPLLLNSVLGGKVDRLNSIDKDKAMKQLADANIKYVVVHNLILLNFGYPENVAFLKAFFKDQKPIYSNGEINVYATSP